MVTITPGYTYSNTSTDPNNEVNASNLATLVDGSVISAIAKAELDSTQRVVEVAATEPASLGDHELWWDSTLSMLRQNLDGKQSVIAGHGSVIYNDESGFLPTGAVVVYSGNGSFYVEACQTGQWAGVAGIVLATIASGATGYMTTSGFCQVLVTGDIGPGGLIVAGDDSGTAVTMTTFAAVASALATYNANIDIGMAMTTALGSGLVTALVWR